MGLPASISYDSPARGPGGAPFLFAANDGLSLSTLAAGTAVFGQNVLQAGDPAKLLLPREVPQEGLGINFFGGGLEFSAIRRAAPAQGVGIHLDAEGVAQILMVGITAHDIFFVQANGNVGVNNVNDGINVIGFLGQRYVGTPLPSMVNGCVSVNARWQPDNTVSAAVLFDYEVISRVNMDTDATLDYRALNITPSLLSSPAATGVMRGIFYAPIIIGTMNVPHVGCEIDSGDCIFNATVDGNQGRSGFQGVRQPTAYVHIAASDGAANNGQIKLDPGTLLAVPEDGVLEYDGTSLFFTVGVTRKTVVLV